MERKHTMEDLAMMQSVPLSIKVLMTKRRIRDWVNAYGESGVYISFSGGKDSTVLLDLVRQDYPNIPAVFVDTGLEYPEIREFVKTFDNVVWLRPKMNFRQVIERYGYPFFSKEVSNNVDGARKYLTEVEKRKNALTDRQTDRQIPYTYNYKRICGIGEYAKQRLGKNKRESSKIGNHIGDEGQDRKGDYP